MAISPADIVSGVIVGTTAGTAASSFLTPVTRDLHYSLNYTFPNLQLSIEDSIFVYHRGYMNEANFTWHLKNNAADIEPLAGGGSNNWRSHAWRSFVDLSQPSIALSAALDCYHRDLLGADSVNWIMTKNGIMDQRERAALFGLRPALPLEVMQGAFQRGIISAEEFERSIIFHGISDIAERRTLTTRRAPLSPERVRANYNAGLWTEVDAGLELKEAGFGMPGDWARVMTVAIPPPETVATQMAFRGVIDEAQYRQSLLHAGYHSREIQDAFISTVRPIPGPADLVRFAIREVWDQPTVDRFGYDEEFPPQLNHWLRKQGLAWGELMPGEPLPAGGVVTWPRAYWRAHWQPISPQQAYDAFHRLRPDRIGRYSGEIAGLTPFTFADLQTILKVADYPKASRPWLAALAFLPLRLIEIRNAYVHGSKDRQWAIDQLRDRGHSLPDANDIVDIWDGNEKYRRGAWIRSLEERQGQAVYREVLAGYEAGWIDYQTAYQRLTGMLVRPETAQTSLDLVDSKKARSYLKEVLRALRKDFLDGSISTVEAVAYLRQAQVPDSESARLVQRWAFLNTLKRRVATASQILQWTRDGLLPASLAVVRLRNLGWQEPDVALALARVQRQSSHSTALALSAQDRQRAAARRQLAQAAKQAKAAQRSAEGQMRTLYPLADLKRWYLSGWRSRDWIVAMLRSQGRKEDWIVLKLTEWGEPRPPKANGQTQAPAP